MPVAALASPGVLPTGAPMPQRFAPFSYPMVPPMRTAAKMMTEHTLKKTGSRVQSHLTSSGVISFSRSESLCKRGREAGNWGWGKGVCPPHTGGGLPPRPGLPCLALLSCTRKWALTAREIRTRFSLRLSHDSDFSNFVRAEQERKGIDVIRRRKVKGVVKPGRKGTVQGQS